MTPDSIRFRRHDNALTIAEAVRVLRDTISTRGEPYARSVYHLDEWDATGLLEGHMAVEKALDVLDTHNSLGGLQCAP